ncbi:CPBP family intramembrane metalloprotease [Gramella sp. AN32]|nr:CPBP family intramembrane metalloprotease [Gramella sp. AN32]
MVGCYFLYFFALSIIKIIFPDINFSEYEQTELQELIKNSPLKFAFLAVVLAPIAEEGIFRSLLKPSAASIKFFICTIVYIIGLMIIPKEAHWALRYVLLALFLGFIYYALGELISKSAFSKICYFFHKNYKIIWIGGALIFGFVHIFNYVDVLQINFALFLMIFPRIIAGYFLGKVKVENKNLIWPIFLHAMNNGMAFIFMLPQFFESL